MSEELVKKRLMNLEEEIIKSLRGVSERVKSDIEAFARDLKARVNRVLEEIELASKITVDSVPLLKLLIEKDGIIVRGTIFSNQENYSYRLNKYDVESFIANLLSERGIYEINVKPRHNLMAILIMWQEPVEG